jgi:hypothetical protein
MRDVESEAEQSASRSGDELGASSSFGPSDNVCSLFLDLSSEHNSIICENL